MAIPSLALIPTGFKDGKLYSVLPESGAGDFDVVRGSGATRVNKDGLIETMASNEPRLDYTDGGCPSLLLEPQSTNLIPYSEDFSNSAWTKANATIASSSVVSPDGETDAYKIVESSGTSFHYIVDFLTLSGATTFSFFAKAGERSKVSAFLSQSGNNGGLFDLSAVTATASGTGSTASIQAVGNGWYRCVVSNDGSSALSTQIRIGVENGALGSYLGDGTSGLYIWGAQVESLPYSTSYIPTSGAIATRLADKVRGAGDATTFNSTEGVLYFEGSALAFTSVGRNITINGGTSNYIRIFYSNSSNKITYLVASNGTLSAVMSTPTLSQVDVVKIAVTWKLNEFKFYLNGALVGTDTSGNTPTALTNLRFSEPNGANDFNGKVKDLRVYNTALTDAELSTLTTL